MSHLSIYHTPTPSEFKAAAGYRDGDPAFDARYSNLTPETVGQCYSRWLSNAWRPFWVVGGHELLVWHYLHDMDGDAASAWVSGFCYPTARGRKPWEIALRTACWEIAKDHCQRQWGYRSLFSYVIASEDGPRHWNEVCCGYHRVGTMSEALPHGDRMVDIIVYSQREKDAALCRGQALRLFHPAQFVGEVDAIAGPFPPME